MQREPSNAIVDGIQQDARFAWRTLRRNPGFSVVAVLTLALGIGANTAIFSVVNGLLLRSLPGVESPESLVEVSQGDGDDFVSISYPIFDHVRRNARTLHDLAAFDVISMAVGGEAAVEVAFGLQVTGNYFDVLGVRPAEGRFFASGHAFPPTVEDAVVISHSLWQRRFASDPAAVGRVVTLSGYPARIIGVTPPGFGGHVAAMKADIFVPIGMPAPQVHAGAVLDGPRNGMLETVGRVAADVGIAAVRAEVGALATDLIRDVEGEEAVYPLQTTTDGAVPGTARTAAGAFLAILMAVVGLLLLITCVNVANMMLARAGERSREIAVRRSMGASRVRLVRQLLAEALLLSLLAAGLGTLLAVWCTRLLTAFEPPVLPFPGMRLQLDFGVDARVLAFTSLLSAFTALLFGLLPALRATGGGPAEALQRRAGAGRRGVARLGRALVAGQMAVTLVLLLGSGLFLRSLQAAQTVDTGFRTDDVWVAGLDLQLNDYAHGRAVAFYDLLVQRSHDVPGVVAAAVAGKLPLAGASTTSIVVPGAESADATADAVPASLHNQSVSDDYFRALDVTLLRGRSFDRRESAGTRVGAVINETMARRFWTIDDAVGQRFRIVGDLEVEVIGVVGDARYHRLVEETPLFAYFSHRQRPRTDMYLHLRAEPGVDPAALWPAVRLVVEDIDASVPLLSAAPLSEAIGIFLLPQRLGAWIAGLVGSFGLLLGAVGLYGVTAYAVSRRRHEIGVRIALGADRRSLLCMLVLSGLTAPLIGMALGLAAATALTRVLQAFLVGVSPLDPLTFAIVAGLLVAVALMATLVPARRAATVDPMITFRAG